MVTAKCKKNIDPYGHDVIEKLEIGKEYELDWLSMGQSNTTIHLIEIDGGYNSVLFDFFEDGEPLNIFDDARFNPYIPVYYR